MTPSKKRYPHYQKLVYEIYLTAKKVAHYFQEHSVTVISDTPLSEIMSNRDATVQVAKWVIELLPLDIKFEAKKAIKSQALVEFLAEWIEQEQPVLSVPEHWAMFFDSSKMLHGFGAGVVFVSPKDGFNPEDSAKNVFLEHLHSPTIKEDPFVEEPLQQVGPSNPTVVDIPAVIDLVEEILVITPKWIEPYLAYLLRQELPEDEAEARQMVRRPKAFTVMGDQLYKKSTTGVTQRCISPEEGPKILQEIHSGTCGHHASSRTLVAKAFRAMFYWHRANEVARDIVDQCVGCQFYVNQSHKSASSLKTIPLTWPFVVWGLDMVGTLRIGESGFTHLLVAVDKFTKWIEAKPIKKLDSATAIQFITEIIFIFGVPHSITTDNGSNFDSDEFHEFCYTQGTRVDYASVVHP
ncbi:uncharacterized protein [Aegilops tauschii subsp. strangulata]|uniref:uncharacterized protein n=1 Tax=Aegilops tauschii subsp. strangulata TaxID=200361 RepID=UPI003CC8BD74